MKLIKQYIINILIALDQLLNAIFGGDAQETVSARLGRNYPNNWLTKFVDFSFGYNHCKNDTTTQNERLKNDDSIIPKVKPIKRIYESPAINFFFLNRIKNLC